MAVSRFSHWPALCWGAHLCPYRGGCLPSPCGGPAKYSVFSSPQIQHQGGNRSPTVWATFFRSWDRICPLVQAFGPTAGVQVYGCVDASTSWGCGGILYIPPRRGLKPKLFGFSRPWSPSERNKCSGPARESTGAFETLAILYWLIQFAYTCRLQRLLLLTDCEAVALAFGKAFSDNNTMLESIRESCVLLAKYQMRGSGGSLSL